MLQRGQMPEEMEGFFDDEPSPLKDVVGLGAAALGGFTLLSQLQEGAFQPEMVSLGAMELGGGLLLMRQLQARNAGKVVITAALLYDLADRAGLIPTPSP